MNSLPPDSAFRATDGELDEIQRLRGTVINREAFRKKRERWDTDTLLACTGGSHRIYPYLADVIALCESKPDEYRFWPDDIPYSDSLKYRLLSDCYSEGLYSPTPSDHRLHGLLDFLYFPDRVMAEAGEDFGVLVHLWKLMAMTVDDTLYRHSSTAYALYAPLWRNVSLRFTIGFDLIDIATYYGNYKHAQEVLDSIRYEVQLLDNQSDVDYYTDNIQRLALNSEAPYQDVGRCLDDLHQYRLLYERICLRNSRIKSGSEQFRHLQLTRATCRGACRSGVRYVMRVLGSNGEIGAGSLNDVAYLADEYNIPSLNCIGINHRILSWTNHDWDTASRTWAVVLAEHHKSLGDMHVVVKSLEDAVKFQQAASRANIKRRNEDYRFLDDVLTRPQLAKWTAGIDKARVQNYVGSLYEFWEDLSQAMLMVQLCRSVPTGNDSVNKQYLDEAKRILSGLTARRHSPKLRHSGYLFSSVSQLVENTLLTRGQPGRDADE